MSISVANIIQFQGRNVTALTPRYQSSRIIEETMPKTVFWPSVRKLSDIYLRQTVDDIISETDNDIIPFTKPPSLSSKYADDL